ncbi:MAG: hypothetical protein AB1571_01020 [Nanoarchaeota archaeon]
MENKKYKIELYERGRQYNSEVIYPLFRGYSSSFPSDFFNSYSTTEIICTNSYKKRY